MGLSEFTQINGTLHDQARRFPEYMIESPCDVGLPTIFEDFTPLCLGKPSVTPCHIAFPTGLPRHAGKWSRELQGLVNQRHLATRDVVYVFLLLILLIAPL
jgi:hypothetical protein